MAAPTMYQYRYYVGQGRAPAEKMVQNLAAGASARPTLLKFKLSDKLQFIVVLIVENRRERIYPFHFLRNA